MPQWSNDFLGLILGAPVLVFLGVVVKVVFDRITSKGTQKVSEKEANTNEFTAIIDGFERSLKAVNERVDDLVIENTGLKERVDGLEETNDSLLAHVAVLESLVPTPPGPPTRPLNIRKRNK